MKIVKTTLLVLAVTAACACSAFATEILDQNFNSSNGDLSTSLLGNGWEVGQTFTVGRSGYLSKIQIPWFIRYDQTNQPNIVFSVRSTDSNGLPSTSAQGKLFETTLRPQDIPCTAPYYTSVDFNTGGIKVTSGQKLAFIFSSYWLSTPGPTFCYYGIDGTTGSSTLHYDRGFYTARLGTTSFSRDCGYDLFFKTYINPVPEPSSLLAMTAGLLGLAGTIRRKRR